jgi:hypothetical protein
MSEVKGQVTRIVRRMADEWAAFKIKQDAGLAELDNLLSGGIGIGEKLKHIEGEFAAAHASRYRGAYVFDFKVDRAQMKRLLNEGLSHDEIGRRAWRYVRSDEPGLVRSRHPFLWFVKGINQYAGDDQAPHDCRHTPACVTEAECTARRAK